MRTLGKLALVALAACQLAACRRVSSQPLEARFPLRVEGHPPVEVRVEMSPQRIRQEAHWIEGARWAVYHHVRMLGRAPATTMTIVDRRPLDNEESPGAGVIPVSAPFVTSDRGRLVEAAIAQAVARAFWTAALRCDDSDGVFIDGLSRYTATVARVAQYDGLRVPAVVGIYEQRWLGGLFPWVIRFERPAWTAPLRRASGRTAAVERTAAALQTLANWIGTPTAEAALRTLATEPRTGCASWRDLRAAVGDVTGLDLSWFFEPAFGDARVFDYGVESLDSVVAPGASIYRTRVVARRYGEAMFTGTSAQPIAPFEAGRGVELRVRFADGSERVDHWDGRAERRTFDYEGASAAVSATVDPRGVIQMDADWTNNSRTLAPKASAASTKWSTLWMLWLQNALLTYASLV